MKEMIGSSKVILCTLSMLSNPRLEESGLFDLIPVSKLVVDEASQLNIGEFMVSFMITKVFLPSSTKQFGLSNSISSTNSRISVKWPFSEIQSSVRAYNCSCPLVLSSLPQVPPFGKEHVKSLQCIFDIAHLKRQAHFLDTQC
jgi:hypothetical protein